MNQRTSSTNGSAPPNRSVASDCPETSRRQLCVLGGVVTRVVLTVDGGATAIYGRSISEDIIGAAGEFRHVTARSPTG